MNLLALIISTTVISLLPILGYLIIELKDKQQWLNLLIALAVGVLLGGAFLHLLPESVAEIGAETTLSLTLVSIFIFFLFEQTLHHHHCFNHQQHEAKIASFGQISLVGDLVHNFIDGLVLAGAFLTNFSLGISTAIAVMLHEIPQEIGDTAILLKAGYNKSQAIKFNLLVATSAIVGALTGCWLQQQPKEIIPYLLPIAAGNFIYLSLADLIPQMMDCTRQTLKDKAFNLLIMLMGVGLMILL